MQTHRIEPFELPIVNETYSPGLRYKYVTPRVNQASLSQALRQAIALSEHVLIKLPNITKVRQLLTPDYDCPNSACV